jgi:hypothetical protein
LDSYQPWLREIELHGHQIDVIKQLQHRKYHEKTAFPWMAQLSLSIRPKNRLLNKNNIPGVLETSCGPRSD